MADDRRTPGGTDRGGRRASAACYLAERGADMTSCRMDVIAIDPTHDGRLHAIRHCRAAVAAQE